MHLVFGAWYSLHNWPYIAMAIMGLGFVIFVHELGHFLAAKMCGDKCEKFYVGFDVPIKLGWGKYGIRLPSAFCKKKWGETEYGIGIIPLGGYVKMLGQDDNPGRQAEMMRLSKEAEAKSKSEADPAATAEAATVQTGDETEDFVYDPRSYMAQTVPERMFIISAGVIMNIIFAFIFAIVAFTIGVPYTKCEVAYLRPGEPAWLANMRPGDKILEIGGVKNPRFKDLQQEVILGDPDKGIPLTVQRTGADGATQTKDHNLKPHKDKIKKRMRAIIGVAMKPLLELAPERVATKGWPADNGKFRGGDRIIAVNGKSVEDFAQYLRILAANPDKELAVTVRRTNKPKAESKGATEEEAEDVTITVAPMHLRRYGLVMQLSPVLAVQPDSPAAAAGIEEGDEIVAIDGQTVIDPIDLPEQLRRRAGETIPVEIKRKVGMKTETMRFDIPSRSADWYCALTEAMELPTLGIAYEVPAVVAAIVPDSPAASQDIQPGDRITQVLLEPASDEKRAEEAKTFQSIGKPIPIGGDEGAAWPRWMYIVQTTLPDTKSKLTVLRGDKTHEIEITPLPSETSEYAERGFVFVSKTDTMRAATIGEAMSLGWRETKYAMLAVYRFLHRLLSGQISPKLLGGPITIAAVAGISAKEGWATLLIFLTLLSANLAVVNFLPIPVLDGGHMVFLVLEAIFRRPVSEKIVIPLTYAGLFLILCLMIFVFGLDVNRFGN